MITSLVIQSSSMTFSKLAYLNTYNDVPLELDYQVTHTYTHRHTQTHTHFTAFLDSVRDYLVSQHQKGKASKAKPIWIYCSKR